ncbi:MAG: hypothetical protein ABII02_02755 [Candidatus Magasanikbacteria bacterium]
MYGRFVLRVLGHTTQIDASRQVAVSYVIPPDLETSALHRLDNSRSQ